MNYVLKYGRTYIIGLIIQQLIYLIWIHVNWASMPYYPQIQHHISWIHGHFATSLICKRCNNYSNWECQMSLNPIQYECKILSLLDLNFNLCTFYVKYPPSKKIHFLIQIIREKVRLLEGYSTRMKGGLNCDLNCTFDKERDINPLFLVTFGWQSKDRFDWQILCSTYCFVLFM